MQHLLKLRIKSSPCQIGCVENLVGKLRNKLKFSQEVHDNILVSLTEAVNNAILHGNKADDKKFVKINCEETTQKIVIRISDEGKGFNPNNVADPTLVENIECCGGRGVYIMKELSDAIHFLDEGRTVEMHFNFKSA